MTVRTAGFGMTVIAVLVLFGSLLAGLRPGALGDTGQPLAVTSEAESGSGRIRVEVLNGAGVAGLARDVTERLRRQGFDVVYYGNAGSLARDSTVVLDRRGDTLSTRRVADALGVVRTETALDTTLYLEATVILAPDFVPD
jgi:hypothetical protein